VDGWVGGLVNGWVDDGWMSCVDGWVDGLGEYMDWWVDE